MIYYRSLCLSELNSVRAAIILHEIDVKLFIMCILFMILIIWCQHNFYLIENIESYLIMNIYIDNIMHKRVFECLKRHQVSQMTLKKKNREKNIEYYIIVTKEYIFRYVNIIINHI